MQAMSTSSSSNSSQLVVTSLTDLIAHSVTVQAALSVVEIAYRCKRDILLLHVEPSLGCDTVSGTKLVLNLHVLCLTLLGCN